MATTNVPVYHPMMTGNSMDPGLLAVAEELANLLDAQAVYVFGSFASGTSTALSDVDLAVLAARPFDAVRLFEARCRAADLLGRPVDLVPLREASPVIAMQVLRKGRLILDRDPGGTARFAMSVPSMYADLRRSRAPIEAALKERMNHAGR